MNIYLDFLSKDYSSELQPEVMDTCLDFLLYYSKLINQNNVRLTISLIRGTITVAFFASGYIYVDFFDDNTSRVIIKIYQYKLLLGKELMKPVMYDNHLTNAITIFLTIDEFTQHITK